MTNDNNNNNNKLCGFFVCVCGDSFLLISVVSFFYIYIHT